jgi:hypothetical protein
MAAHAIRDDMARHALFALVGQGEALDVAIRVGLEARERGHDVELHAPPHAAYTAKLEGLAYTELDVEDAALCIDAICEEADTVLVVDVLPTISALGKAGLERMRKNGKLVVLDPWDVGLGGRTLDVATTRRDLPKGPLLSKKRLVPVPCASPESEGAFRALPEVPPEAERTARRASARKALGVGDDDRVLVLNTGLWQAPPLQRDAECRLLAKRVPELLLDRIDALGEHVHVLHVSPYSLPWEERLGARYHWVVPSGVARTGNRYAAADLVLTLDMSAAAVGWAIAWNAPLLVVSNAFGGTKAADVVRAAKLAIGDKTRAWLEESVPLIPFRSWPVGLHRTLQPPPGAAPSWTEAELLDEVGFHDASKALLFDAKEIDRARRAHAEYAETLAGLKGGGELWEELAETAEK